jgi:DNA polymerase III sliding clamp (beta) subunit (PCNA family)
MATTNRDALLKLLSLVRGGLSTQSFIPALTHIRFADGYATTFNDVLSLSVKVPVDLELCVPGELVIKALGSFNAEQVMLQEGGPEEPLVVSSGKSKLKVPTLSTKQFPLEMPRGKPEVVPLTDELLVAINKCRFSVGSDPTHPAQMGVTLATGKSGTLVAYSTDNFTISRALTASKVRLPGDAPVILPTAFCEQILALSKAFPDADMDLEIYASALRVTFGKSAWVMTKTLALESMEFEKIISKYLNPAKLKEELQPLPTAFDSCWNRALLVLGAEADKSTKVTVSPDSAILFSSGAAGESTDTLPLDGAEKMEFHVDPTLVVRAAKQCGSVAFFPGVMVLASDDATFVHIISHCAA